MAKLPWRGAWALAAQNMHRIRLEDIKAYARHFNEADFRGKVRSVACLLGDHLLLPIIEAYCALKSSATPARKKALIIGALGYFVLPIDIIPDFIPGLLGFSDDLMVISILLKNLADVVTPDLKLEARRVYRNITGCRAGSAVGTTHDVAARSDTDLVIKE